jgi:hypothetical protein
MLAYLSLMVHHQALALVSELKGLRIPFLEADMFLNQILG